MKTDPIEQLLHEADQRQTLPSGTADAASQAQRILARAQMKRRRARLGAAGAAVTMMVLACETAVVLIQSEPVPVQSQVAQVSALQELSTLRAQIAAQQALVDRMIAVDQRVREERIARQEPPVNDDPMERAAAIVILQADRVRNTPGLAPQALHSYDSVIKHFPETGWAQQARRRAAELRKES